MCFVNPIRIIHDNDVRIENTRFQHCLSRKILELRENIICIV